MSMYSASIPVFIRALNNLDGILEKGRGDAQTRGYGAEVLLGARLAPDMFPLLRQVQIATDMVKNGAARLAGMEPPTVPDTETSFADLHARIEHTIAYLQQIQPAQLEASAARSITLTFPHGEMIFSGADYLNLFVLPNLYFHATTAFNILRHNGVAIGKRDFLGG